MEIPEDESCAELGLLEDSFSSVFSEDFSLRKKKNPSQSVRCGKWISHPDLQLGLLAVCEAFLVLDARKQGQPLQGPSEAATAALSLC